MGMGYWAIGGLLSARGKPLGWGDVDDDESIRAIRHAIFTPILPWTPSTT
jgi:hypothetical protein